MRRSRHIAGLAAVPAFLVLPFTALGGTGIAAAAPAATGAAAATVCSGTSSAPGTLAGGTYTAVEVKGVCAVNGGQAVVTGNVTLDANASLLALFATNARVHGATSGLNVHGNILVGTGATLALGCDAQSQPCLDDNQEHPTLNGPDEVGGSILATNPLGVIVHDVTIAGDARQTGGGGGALSGPGAGCTPTGIFASLVGSPVFSNYEDNTIGGNLWVSGLQTCWFGAFRNHVGGSISVVHNTMADPDATEVLTNQIRGNLICTGNSPAAQYGDSEGMPNTVSGFAVGECSFSAKAPNPAPVPASPGPPPTPATLAGPLASISVPAKGSPGYDLGGGDGGVFAFGTPFFGSAPGTAEILPYSGIATAPGGLGYWLANGSGLVRNFGPNAADLGSAATLNLQKPVVSIAAAPGGDGYWEAASDGGVFGYGPDAPFYGSAGAVQLAKPIVGMAAVPTGNGYDLVATDGGVFTYGPGAAFHGSLGNLHLNGPIVAMAIDPATGGYWLVGSDGGVFSFDAPYLGSLGNIHLNSPIVGIAAAPTGNGYYLVASDGGVFAFGPGAHFSGSLGAVHLSQPIDGIALG
jgi:hypothetical protein